MLYHFAIILISLKLRNKRFNQKDYDYLFHNIENNLREMGFGDVAVNKKMKDFNKIFYDILIKLNSNKKDKFEMNNKLVFEYFPLLKGDKKSIYLIFKAYFEEFFNFCFEHSSDNVINNLNKFKYSYGSS